MPAEELAVPWLLRRTKADAGVTALDFVHEVDDDWLAVADQAGGLRLIRIGRDRRASRSVDPADIREVKQDGSVAYGLAYVPRRMDTPGLAAVGERMLFVYDSMGDKLLGPIHNPADTTALAVEALAGIDDLPVIAVGGKDNDEDANVYLYSGDSEDKDKPLLNDLCGQHRGAVRALKALRLERQLAVAHDGGITIWDLSNGAEKADPVRTFGQGDSHSLAVFYDPQGRPRLATASPHGIQTWDPASTGPPLSMFAKPLNATEIVAVTSKDGDPQLAVAHGRTVSLWSTTTEQKDGELPVEDIGEIKHLAKILTGDGATLLAAGDDQGHVVVWELPRVRSTTKEYGRHNRWVNALIAVRADDQVEFASASDDRTVQVWSLAAGAPKSHVLPAPAAVQALAVVPHPAGDRAELLVAGDEAGHIQLWHMPDRNSLDREDSGGRVRALATFRDGSGQWRVVAAGAGTIAVWDPRAPAGKRSIENPFEYPGPATDTLIRTLAVEEQLGLLAAGDSHGRVTVWETADGRRRWTDNAHHKGQIRTLAWVPTPDGVRLATGGSDGMIYLWSPDEDDRGGEHPRTVSEQFAGHTGPVATIAALSKIDQVVPVSDGDMHLFVSGGADGTICTWNPDDSSRPIHTLLSAHPSWVRTLLRLEHAGTLWVFSGGDDGTIRQWVVEEGKLRSTRHGVQLRGFGDRPAKKDLLDRDELQQELVALLRLPMPAPRDESFSPHDPSPDSDAGDGIPTTGPRVVAVQGAWGAGKTSLMNLIFRTLSHDDRTAGPGRPSSDTEPPPSTVASGRSARTRRGPAPKFTPLRAYRLAGSRARRQSQAPSTPDDTRTNILQLWSQARGRSRAPSTPDDAGPKALTNILPVWFNPWAHKSTEEVWAGLTSAIIEAARKVLGNPKLDPDLDSEWHEYWFTRNLAKMDPAEIRRTLRERIVRPMLPALLVVISALVAALARDEFALVAVLLCVGVLGAMVARVAWVVRRDASEYLPAGLLRGPVLSGPFAKPGSSEQFPHDPLYQARSGYLYLVQHDIKIVVRDLARKGYQLVVFVDDLDRCPPDTVAEVFEAINILLAEDFSTAKFVIGLDPSVVTRRLAEAFPPEESSPWHYPDDPTPGWSFLGKLCQLPVTLPGIREAHTARLLRRHTPTAAAAAGSATPQDNAEPVKPGTGSGAPALAPAGAASPASRLWHKRPMQPDARPDDPTPEKDHPPSTGTGGEPATETDPQTLLFEGNPVVRDHLRTLISLRPHQSVRETKRLLTLWGFYLRLLQRLLPDDTTSSTHFGRDVLTFAEILTRWPALVPVLGPGSSVESGLHELMAATQGPHQELSWDEAVRKLGIDGPEYRAAAENLRRLLNDHGNDEVAYYAQCVL